MKSILIVDDDTFVGGAYAAKFRSLGFEARTALSGRDALTEIARHPPNVVLLDLMLGDMTGVEVLTFVRGDSSTSGIPVVVLSNTYMGELVEAAWKAGATQCLSKTAISPNRVVEEVQKALVALRVRDSLPPFAPTTSSEVTMRAWPASPEQASLEEDAVQSNVRRQLRDIVLHRIDDLRDQLRRWRTEPMQNLPRLLAEMNRSAHMMVGSAALAGYARLAQIAGALESLLTEQLSTRARSRASSMRTIGMAIEFLPVMFRNPSSLQIEMTDTPLVLVVDDDPISRGTLCASLEKIHLRPLVAGNPLLAAELFEENRFDLVLFDLEMPGLDGFALADKLRAADLNQATPILFVTALDDLSSRERSTNKGAVDYITKPVVPAELALKAMIYICRGKVLASIGAGFAADAE